MVFDPKLRPTHPNATPAVSTESPENADAIIQALIDRNLRGQALGVMMSVYGDTIARFFTRRLRSTDRVEDLTQETFIRAMQGLSSFRGECRILTWLTRIAYNVMCTTLSKEQRQCDKHRRFEQHTHTTLPNRSTRRPDRVVWKRELSQAVDTCLNKMNPIVRELAVLVWIEGHTFVEASHITGLSEDAVRKRLCRARPILQRCLKQRGIIGLEETL